MAQKRMFSLSVVDTDNFLEMPVSARLLYYELGMRADDDGFVDNWKKILLFTGLKEDDLKVLILKSFVIPFESGVIVIRHWRMNNYLQSDRYKATIYQEEFKQLNYDKDNNVYNLDTKCIHSIDKNRLDKYNIDNNNEQNANVLKDEFEQLWKKYPNKKGKKDALKHFTRYRKKGIELKTIEDGLDKYINYINQNNIKTQYIKHGSTWFNEECWNDEYETKKKYSIVPEWLDKDFKEERKVELNDRAKEIIRTIREADEREKANKNNNV